MCLFESGEHVLASKHQGSVPTTAFGADRRRTRARAARRNTTMKPTPDWAAAWDAYWLAPSSAWESYWRGTGLSCGATGLCSMLGLGD